MRIVLCPGCFDMFHDGHARLLSAAKRSGDRSGDSWLIVAVNTDESVKALKGPERPVQSLRVRMAAVARHHDVDAVIPFNGAQYELIDAIRPDIVVKGSDYTEDRVVGHHLIRAYGGTIRIIERIKGISTSESLQKQPACGK